MTGMGSLREVKEMRIEFDVFKKLSQGQAVLIDKAYHREDLLRVWRTESSLLERSKKGCPSLLRRLSSACKTLLSVRKVLPPLWSKPQPSALKGEGEEQDTLHSEWEKHRLSLIDTADEEWKRESFQIGKEG